MSTKSLCKTMRIFAQLFNNKSNSLTLYFYRWRRFKNALQLLDFESYKEKMTPNYFLYRTSFFFSKNNFLIYWLLTRGEHLQIKTTTNYIPYYYPHILESIKQLIYRLIHSTTTTHI